jgi:TolB protein
MRPNMFKRLSSLLLVTLVPLVAFTDAPPQEIRVQLSTATPLTPVYIGKLQVEDGSMSKDNCEQLEAVLIYDFNHNGSTTVVSLNEKKEQLLKLTDPKRSFNPADWKPTGASHVIKGTIRGSSLILQLFSVQTGFLKQFQEIPLTGALSRDRRQIHKAHDALYKAAFGVDGIASTQIIYAAQVKHSSQPQADWVSEIWMCDWDGANGRQLTKEKNYCVTPVFLPRSSRYPNDRFLYVSYKASQPKIFIGSLSDPTGKRLIDLSGNQLLPAISPQRDKIAFICDAGGRTDLFLQTFHPEKDQASKPIQLFSYPQSTQASPTFSPDGNKLAFVSDKDGAPRVYVIPATTNGAMRSNPVLISRQNNENSCPSWSPDGRKLAYSAKTKGVRQIWIYDFDTKEERQLTDGPGNKENPSWAPDSCHLVFNSTDVASSELYIVNLNQTEAIKISHGPGKKHYPSWGIR